jgi:hypothetical protein
MLIVFCKYGSQHENLRKIVWEFQTGGEDGLGMQKGE